MTDTAKTASFVDWRKSIKEEQRQLVDRILGDVQTLAVPRNFEEELKKLLMDSIKVEVKSEVGEHHREEKREDARRDERREGERGEKPEHELPGTPTKPGTLPGQTPTPKK